MRSFMRESSFEYGALAIGIYKAMLWLVILITFTVPILLIYYVPLLFFLGLGLRPFLISTGLHQRYQFFSAKRDERIDEKLKQGYYKRNAKKVARLDKRLKEMRKKMSPKE
jgi:hypothetical protein